MAECILIKPGGAGSDDVTANKAQVLEGYTAITHDSDDEPGEGTIPNNGSNKPSTSVGKNDTVGLYARFPKGYYELCGDGTNPYVRIDESQAASAGGLTAAKIGKGQTAFGLTGAYNGLGNAGVTDVRKGKTFSSTALSNATGTMIEKAAATYTPKTTNQTIAASQYLVGAQTIKGDANLLAANIKKGVTIFGVAGAYEGKWVFHNGIVGGWGLSKKLYVPSNGGESCLDLGAKLANQVRTTARVNLNLYSKVKLTVSYGTNEYKVTNRDFRIYALDEQAPSSGVASKYIILGLLPSNTKATYEFDISDWGGAYYLGVSQDSERTLGTHSSAYLKITEMWLE